MRETRTYGSVRGARRQQRVPTANLDPFRKSRPIRSPRRPRPGWAAARHRRPRRGTKPRDELAPSHLRFPTGQMIAFLNLLIVYWRLRVRGGEE